MTDTPNPNDLDALGLLEKVYEGRLSLEELAEETGLSLSDLARWAAAPGNVRLLDGLVRLADVRAQMMISRYRTNAAAQLVQIATGGEPNDLARKACVDLLRTELRLAREERRTATGTASGDDEPPAAPSEEAILAALERIARPDEEDPDAPG